MPRPKKNKTPLPSIPVETPSRQLLQESRKALLLDSDDDDEDFQAVAASPALKVNEEYARRFEHNKKREELQRLEEKYGKDGGAGKRGDDYDSEDESSSSSEDEDDIAVLATEKLDKQIQATLEAIRNKDPRVYDGKTTFYDPIDADAAEAASEEEKKKEKPMYLRDYHRENLLAGNIGAEDEEDADAPKTFAQQQEDLKKTVVREMHAAAEADADDDEDEAAFMVRKSKPEDDEPLNDLPDPSTADPNNPDEYLQKFLSSRVWAKSAGHVPLESDDSESEAEAEQREFAYNMRFENPDALERAKLVSYGRDAVNAQSVRREEKSRRKKAREEKRKRKEEEKIQREIEKKRLMKLKTEEMMEKIKKIQEAAGLDLDPEAEQEVFAKLLEGDFSEEEWEKWMQERFGEGYYKEKDPLEKPEFDDDIDIKDIVPDFTDDELDVDEEAGEGEAADAAEEDTEEVPGSKKRKTKRELVQESRDKKNKEKSTRRKLERFLEENLDLDLPGGMKGTFRYRETTPETYGLTPLDILAAADPDLNSYAGLKKYASFRDKEKKERDRKKYAKKKRLKQWRKEVFGDPNGPQMPPDWKPEGLVQKKEQEAGEVVVKGGDGEGEGPKRKRRKKNKSKA